MYLRLVAQALCLTGLLAESFVQETDHGEQTIAVLEGEQRNIREIQKQFDSRRTRKSAYTRRRIRRDGEHNYY